MKVGDIDVVPLSDGTAVMPPKAFWVGFDFDRHPDVLAPDGNLHMPIGCYLVRTGDQTVLLDAGMGPHENESGRRGRPARPAAGRRRVARRHRPGRLHPPAPRSRRLARARRRPLLLAGDGALRRRRLEALRRRRRPDDRIAEGMRLLWDAGRLDPIDGDMVALAPGLTARYTPGPHRRATTRWWCPRVTSACSSSATPSSARCRSPRTSSTPSPTSTRPWPSAHARPCGASSRAPTAQVGAAHFPGLQVGRILTGNGKRCFA